VLLDLLYYINKYVLILIFMMNQYYQSYFIVEIF
jgi:hypothetical protein